MTLPAVPGTPLELVTSLPGVVVTRLERSLRLDTTNADSEQWAAAVAFAEATAPPSAMAEVFRVNGTETWVYTW